jgi:DNA repair protein RecO (recombination protein O)
VGAKLRGGRRSSKRASGGIEPFHTLDVAFEDRGGELLTVKETRFVTVRAALVASLDAMEAAGVALRWARHLCPSRHAEPHAWATVTGLLDELEAVPASSGPLEPRRLLAVAGFRLLSSVGYALDLERCVVCGRPCPPGAPAFIDGPRGGLVCRSCGGSGRLVSGRARELARDAQRDDVADPRLEPATLTAVDVDDLLAVLADAMAAHTGLDPSK